MGFITGVDRQQIILFPDCVDDYIDSDNEVRAIDAYIDSVDLQDLGFKKTKPEATGRPPFSPQDMAKLYIYGYMNRIRSSRRLEREIGRNVELMWLLKKLRPDHVTIANFRKNNVSALKKLFRDFVKLCRDLNLYGGELTAIDGSKFEAVNSTDKNFNDKKLEDRIKRLDSQIETYLQDMNDKDNKESTEENAKTVNAALEELKKRKAIYESYKNDLKESDESQISLTDPESRRMLSNGRSDMCYNVQSSVDSLNKMIVEFAVTNDTSDINQLNTLAKATAEILEAKNLEATVDKGYDNASEAAACLMAGITPHIMGSNYNICIPSEEQTNEPITSHHQGRCVYLPDRNVAVCPMGNILTPSSYKTNPGVALFRNGKACANCSCKCTNEKYKRYEVRMPKSQFTKEHNSEGLRIKQVLVQADKEKTKLRKSIAEHPFGTIKRAMDARYTLMKGIAKVTGEFSLIFLAYNLKRVINIMGVKRLIEAIKNRNNNTFF